MKLIFILLICTSCAQLKDFLFEAGEEVEIMEEAEKKIVEKRAS